MKFRILDLFCGAGGFSYGLHKNKDFDTKIGVDNDSKVMETFLYNNKNSVGIVGNIANQDVKDNVIKLSKEKQINMVVGGPPCQGFSLKGKMLGLDDPRNFLFKEYFYIVDKLKPEIFIIENVKNLISSCNGYFINEIILKFSSIGYTINYGILNAKDFGVPQNRERAIIIGSISKSIPLPKKTVEKITTVEEAISDLNFLNSGEGDFKQSYKFPPLSDYQKKMRLNSNLYNHKATNHSELALKKLKMVPPEGDKSYIPKNLHGNQKFSTTWSRLKWMTVSPTIDTRFDTPSNGRNSHPCLNRSITPREAARIQSFDDNFIFFGNKTSICKQIGNAVPPMLATEIGKTIIKCYQIKKGK